MASWATLFSRILWPESSQAGNLQVARMSVTMQLLWSAGIPWILEQPASSVMSVHPKMRIVYERMGW